MCRCSDIAAAAEVGKGTVYEYFSSKEELFFAVYEAQNEVLARRNQGRTGSPYVSWIPTYNGQEWNILEITPKGVTLYDEDYASYLERTGTDHLSYQVDLRGETGLLTAQMEHL